jgi:hypothetical protein
LQRKQPAGKWVYFNSDSSSVKTISRPEHHFSCSALLIDYRN